MKRLLTTWLGMVAVLGLTLGTVQAQAATAIFTLGTGNAGGAGSVRGPYGQVVVTDTGPNQVSLAVTASNTSDRTSSANQAVFNDLQFNDTVRATVPSTPQPQSVGGFLWTLGAGSSQGFGNFGAFNQSLTTSNSSQRLTSGTFTLSGPTGFNSSSFTAFKVHWYSNTDPGETQVTGFATSVPEPGPLLGAGVVTLMGLGYTWHRRRRTTA